MSGLEKSETCMTMQLTTEQRVFLVPEWIRTGSLQQVAEAFGQLYACYQVIVMNKANSDLASSYCTRSVMRDPSVILLVSDDRGQHEFSNKVHTYRKYLLVTFLQDTLYIISRRRCTVVEMKNRSSLTHAALVDIGL